MQLSPERARRAGGTAGLLFLALCAYGLLTCVWLAQAGEADRDRPSQQIFTWLFANFEPPLLLLGALFVVGVVAATQRDRVVWSAPVRPPSRSAIATIALLQLAAGVAGTLLVTRGYLLSMDEFGAHFQAQLFAHGEIAHRLPEQYGLLGKALTPVFVTLRADQSWLSQYLPGYAAIRASFSLAGMEPFTNAVLTAATTPLLAGVARQMWPEDGLAAWLAIGFFATSTQVLAMSWTGYSYAAHLFFNVLWLWLFLRPGRTARIGMAATGAVALMLHNPAPHTLFAAPLLVVLWRREGWRPALAIGAVYGVAVVAGSRWFAMSAPPTQGPHLTTLQRFGPHFDLPPLSAWQRQIESLALLFDWHTPLVAIAFFAAVLLILRLGALDRALLAGLALTFGLYLVFKQDQAHGWGYRYAHPVLANLLLLAAGAGASVLRACGKRWALALMTISAAATFVVQAPARAAEVARVTAPFERARVGLSQAKTDLLLLAPESGYYVRDLLRNDPLMRDRPLIASIDALTCEAAPLVRRLQASGRARRISAEELASYGLYVFDLIQRPPERDPLADCPDAR